MNSIKCNICGAQLNENEQICKYCGNKLPAVNQKDVNTEYISDAENTAEACSVNKYAAEEAERQVFVPEQARRYCSKCGRPLDGKTNKCVVCEAAEVSRSSYHEDTEDKNTEGYDMAGSRKRKRKQKGRKASLFVLLFVILIVLFFVSVHLGVKLLGGLSQSEEATESPEPTAEVVATLEPDAAKTQEPLKPEPTKEPAKPTVSEPPSDEPDAVIDYYGGEYLFPSYEKIITEKQLDKLERQEIKLILQEIYARYGYTFNDDDLIEHFESQSWYVPTTTDMEEIEAKLNKYEKENISIIEEYQRKKGWRI